MQALQVTRTAAIRWTEVPGLEPALVIVPGLGASAVAHFLHVVTHPALRGRRALLVDLLGFGTSDRPMDFDYSVSSHAASIARVLSHLGLGPFDLVGHSLGGSIAVHLTHLAPDAVGRLVAVEPNLDPWDGTASVDIARQSENEFVANGFAALLGSAGPQWRATLRLADPVALHRTALGLCAGPDEPLRRTLLQARSPRTLVWGAQSPPPSGLDELRAGGITYVEIPASGHVPMEDAPDALAQTLAAALPLP